MEAIELRENIPCAGEYDVIVAGGGVAGVAAAVSAWRTGARALLIEKSICLGGLATIGLVNLFVPMCNGRGVQIIRGMADELLRLSVKYGFNTLPADWRSGEYTVPLPENGKPSRLVTRFSAPVFIMALTEFIRSEGVDVMFDTYVTRPVMDGGRCTGLVVENKSGRAYYRAKMYVDATGDADILRRAGVPTVAGGNFHTFYMYGADAESCAKAAHTGDMAKLFKTYWGGSADLHGANHPAGKRLWDGADAADVTAYVVENHIEALGKLKSGGNSRDLPASRDILQIPTMPQFRTTRRIDGDYTLTESDIYRHFDDSIGAICDFERRDSLFEIPLRALTRRGFGNIITTGRCVSGAGRMWDITRVIPPAIITGQAAGVACVLAAREGTEVYNVNIRELQSILEKQNVMVHFDDSLIPAGASAGEEAGAAGHI